MFRAVIIIVVLALAEWTQINGVLRAAA